MVVREFGVERQVRRDERLDPRHDAERVERFIGSVVVAADIRRHAVVAEPARQATADLEIGSRHVEAIVARLREVDIFADVKGRAERADRANAISAAGEIAVDAHLPKVAEQFAADRRLVNEVGPSAIQVVPKTQTADGIQIGQNPTPAEANVRAEIFRLLTRIVRVFQQVEFAVEKPQALVGRMRKESAQRSDRAIVAHFVGD